MAIKCHVCLQECTQNFVVTESCILISPKKLDKEKRVLKTRRIILKKTMQNLALDVTEWFVPLLAPFNFVKISYLPKKRSGGETSYSVSLRTVVNKECLKYAPRIFYRLYSPLQVTELQTLYKPTFA